MNSQATIDPNVAIFELFQGDKKLATLYDPKREEMFWCSYRIEPTSEEADTVLRSDEIWNEVKFTIKDPDGSFPNPNTFSGGHEAFVRKETDRLSFRSLWPPARHIPRKPSLLLSLIRRFIGKKP